MANNYILNWTDDALKPPFTLLGNTIDSSRTSLKLTAKASVNWGECVIENFLKLLENFASNGIPPSAPTAGQLWYDVNSNRLLMRTTGSSPTWVVVWPQVITPAPTPPAPAPAPVPAPAPGPAPVPAPAPIVYTPILTVTTTAPSGTKYVTQPGIFSTLTITGAAPNAPNFRVYLNGVTHSVYAPGITGSNFVLYHYTVPYDSPELPIYQYGLGAEAVTGGACFFIVDFAIPVIINGSGVGTVTFGVSERDTFGRFEYSLMPRTAPNYAISEVAYANIPGPVTGYVSGLCGV